MVSSRSRHIEIIVFLLIFIYIILSIPAAPTGPTPVKVTYPYDFDVNTLDFSTDGKFLAIGYDEGFVRIWDLVDGEQIYDPGDDIEKDRLLRTLGRHNVTGIDSIKFSPDGRYLLSGGYISRHAMRDNNYVLREEDDRIDATEVILWDVSSGQRLQSHYLKYNLGSTVDFSADGTSYAASFKDRNPGNTTTINIWSTETGEVLNSITTSDYMAQSLAFTPDGNYLVASYLGRPRIVFWNLETMEAARIVKTHDTIKDLDFSNEGNVFAGITDDDGHVIIWDTKTGSILRTFTNLEGSFANMDMSPDGEYVAGIRNNRMVVWNVSSGEKILEISSLPKVDSPRFAGLQFSPDTQYLAVGVDASKRSSYSLSSDNYTRARSNNVSFDLIFGLTGTNPVYLWDFQDLKEGNYIETFWELNCNIISR